MARLYDVPYGKLQEFLKRLSQAGFTAIHLEELVQNPELIAQWVRWLDESPEAGLHDTSTVLELPIKKFFDEDSRTWHPLARAGICTVAGLTDWSRDELLGIRTVGEKTVNRIETKLNRHGLTLSSHSADDPNRVLNVDKTRAHHKDQVNSLGITEFIKFSDRDCVESRWFYRMNLTVGDIRNMDDDKLAEHFTTDGIHEIRRWIEANLL